MSGPLLMVGHGSRDPAGASGFAELVALVAARLDVPVTGGFIELSPPPLHRAVTELLAAHPGPAAAVPVVLSAAGHAKGDIPAALAREAARQGLRYVYGRPLGMHPGVLQVVEERIDEVLEPARRGNATVLLVGRGSTDPDANAEHAKLARLLWEGRGFGDVLPAFVSLAEPGVSAGLDRAARLGARLVVVLPYFLFDGVLPIRVGEQARAWGAGRPDVEVRVASVLGPCQRLADVVVERWSEAWRGDIRMNCDTCRYRVALPGHEHAVGAAAHPHHHPEDPA